MRSFVIIGFLVATFFQAEGRSISTNENLNSFEVELGRLADECLVELLQTHNKPLQSKDESDMNELWGCIFEKRGIVNNQSVFVNEDKLEDYLFDMFAAGESPDREKQIRDVANEIAQQCKYVYGNNNGQTAAKVLDCINSCLDKNV